MTKSITVKVRHLGYKRKLRAIGSMSARDTYFNCEELKFGGRISVEKHFLKSKSHCIKKLLNRSRCLQNIKRGELCCRTTGRRSWLSETEVLDSSRIM